jgi:hypothetical protein
VPTVSVKAGGTDPYSCNTVTLTSSSKTLTIQFKSPSIATQWGAKLNECVSRRSSYGESSESSLGNIFDITYMQREGAWRNFKLTFVKNEWSCEEFLLFDSSQEDLGVSTAEAYHSIDSRLDLVNQQIWLGFLRQTEVTEKSSRMTKKTIKPFLPGFTFSYSANARLISSYKDVDNRQTKLDIEQLYSQTLSNKHDFITQAFSLIELQKSTQVSTIARYAQRQEFLVFDRVRNQVMRNSDALSAKEPHDDSVDHLVKIMSKRRQVKEDEAAARRQGIKVPERSCGGRALGEVCDCHIF